MAFLEAINAQSIWDRVRPVLGDRTRPAVIAGAAAAVAVVVVGALWFWSSSYAVLYAGLSGEEGGRAIAELQKLNIPYQITEGGRVIQVPAADVGRARLQLAARGVVKHDGDEWAILDSQSLGVSPFVEQVHYVRGIEAALSRTVGQVDGVVSAKVTLALPKQTEFLGNQPKPSAAVMVRLRAGVTLSGSQVAGIMGLVASSVPGLGREQVTVIDQSGNVLNPDNKDVVLQAQQLDIAREVNQRYEKLLTDLLVPVLGHGNFRIASDADIDFSRSKESLVKYGESHVLSQDETTHQRADGDAPVGIPGALSNRRPDTPSVSPPPKPPAQPATPDQPATPAAAAPAPPADTHKTTNFDLDKTVEYLEHPSWRLRSVNVAVLVNNPTGARLPAEKLQSIDKLVSSAIGAGQNPRVTVVDLPFETSDGTAIEPAAGWWRDSWVGAVTKNALLAAAGLFALFGGLFPLLRRLAGAQAAVAASAVRARPKEAEPETGEAVKSSRIRALTEPQDVFSIEADTVQTLVTHDPARTAQVIRGWIAGDRSNVR